MQLILILPILLGFFITLFFLPYWIKKAKQIGLIWEDMNKYLHPKGAAGSGGLIVLFGFSIGVLLYVAIKTFIIKGDVITTSIFAILTTVIIAGIVGLVDDFLGWKKGGLPAWFRICLMLIAAIPLIVINAGEHDVAIPLIGVVSLGIWYAFIIVPIGVMGASTGFNILAGFNGLEASQGIIILSSLALVTALTGKTWVTLIALIMVASLAAFYVFNKHPAKVFPGDVMTYSVGALIACIAIFGNIERFSLLIFTPYFIEGFLKIRGKLNKQSFGKPNKDHSLEVPYEKFYGLEHIAIYLLKKIKKDGKAYEKEVVYLINLFQIIIVITALILFRKAIF